MIPFAFGHESPSACTWVTVAMPPDRAALVLGLTLLMCAASGALATRRLASADPADVF